MEILAPGVTQIIKSVKKILDLGSVGIGDLVGFKHNGSQVSGVVTKLNPKRVKLVTKDNQVWNVCYEFLFAIVDVVDTRGMMLIDV